MKVLQIIDSLNVGGAEKLLLDTIPLYTKKGIEMDILLLHDKNYPFTQALEKENCCQIYRLGEGSVYNPLHIFKIAKIINNYDIAHVHLFPAQYWAVLANLIKGNKTKLIFTEHNTTNNRLSNSVLSLIDKQSYKFFNKIIAITDEIKYILKSHTGLKENKFITINNGVNINRYKTASPIERESINPFINSEDILISQVSGFRLQKDQQTLIRALSHLPENYKVLLIGDGEYRTHCEELVKKLSLQNRCFFLGKRTDIPQLLQASDYVVLSSKYEGLSLSSIEGMASGKPFIASDVPGLREIVDGYGVLFPQGDEKTLANKILELNNNTELYNETIRKCQERAEQFDIHTMVDKHIKLYEELCN